MSRRLTERQLQKAIIGTAEMLGWRVCHFDASVKIVNKRGGGKTYVGDKQAKGFPDLVLVRPPRLMFVELKGHSTRIDDEQIDWLRDLTACANFINEAAGAEKGKPILEVYIWRPNDWESEVITRRLR